MKRLICALLLISTAFSAFSVIAYAESATYGVQESAGQTAAEEANDTEELFKDVLSYTCVFDTQAKRIRLSGTLDNKLFAEHSKWSLAVYAVPPGTTEYEVLNMPDSKPLAEATVSIKFEFSFKADDIISRYSRYAVFLRSPEGESVLCTEAQFPEVPSTFQAVNDKRYYKGLCADFDSRVTDISPGTAILPLYWDELFSETPSSVFILADGKQYFFNKDTVDELDVALRSMSASGNKIYLRLYKKSEENSSAEYVMPDVYDHDTVARIHAAVSFLTDRYGDREFGVISGYILGKGWETPKKYNYGGNITFEEYVRKCATYAVIVANAARMIDSSIDVVIPLSGNEFLTEPKKGQTKNAFKQTAEGILSYFDASFYAGINCSFLLDTSDVPLGISNSNVYDGIKTDIEDADGKFYAGLQTGFSDYLFSLGLSYKSCPEKYIFSWTPPSTLNGIALSAAYAYSYYKLLSDNAIYLFAVDFSKRADIEGVAHLMKYIDTDKGVSATQSLAKLFDKKSWKEIVSAELLEQYAKRQTLTAPVNVGIKEDFKGSFYYFNFANSNLVENWYKGVGCISIKSDYRAEQKKSLCADLLLDGTDRSSEVIYIYGYPENMSYTSHLNFSFSISDDADNSLYEVKFTLENNGNRIEGSSVIRANEEYDVMLDISEFANGNTTEAVRISVRSLDGKSGECSLWINDICGYSQSYDSETLEELINISRENMRNPNVDEENRTKVETVAFAIGIVLAIGALGLGIFVSFKRNSSDSGDDDAQ